MFIQPHRLEILTATAFILLTGMANLYSQTEVVQQREVRNSLFKGSTSLQFRITDNFNLAFFQGATLSAKRHSTNKKALRFGLSLSGSVMDDDQSSTNQSSKNKTDQNGQFVAITMHSLNYPSPDREVNLFWGFGPSVSYSRGNVTTLTTSTNGLVGLFLNQF